LNNGADPNIKDVKGQTALHYAFENGNLNMVKMLSGVNPNIEDLEGQTALIVAARWDLASGVNNRETIVYRLLNNGADPNIKDVKGQTALHYASENGNLNMVKMLIEKGANRM
jgi:ankyrin repeat protein